MLLSRVTVRDDLVVRDEDVGMDAHASEVRTRFVKGAKVVAEVEATRRAVSGEHRDNAAGVLGQVRTDVARCARGATS